MKQIQSLKIGQVISLGFGLVLLLALLIGVLGRIAYDISRQQNATIQTRSNVERLALQLEIISIQRTDALRHYLEENNPQLLATFQAQQTAYADTYSRLAPLLNTPAEQTALQTVAAAESHFNEKATEILDLYNDGFPAAAQFLWLNEGLEAQRELLQAVDDLRLVQGQASSEIIEAAHATEQLTINAISLFIPFLLLGGVIASIVIARNITQPIAHLLNSIKQLGTDLTVRVTPSGPKEIEFLGETINEMAKHLLQTRRSLQAYHDRLHQELALASQIQASFLPDTLAGAPGLDVAVYWKSAREIGGDFYAQFSLENGQQVLSVGDVSGKGAPAAMAGALVVGMLQAYAANNNHPEALLSSLNHDLAQRLASQSMNVACCYALLDLENLCFTVANAGCMYPYLRRDNSVHEISVRGLPLGVISDFEYTAQQMTLKPGDLLLFSSDGLVEAQNETQELFGFERLRETLMALPSDVDAQGAVNHLQQVVFEFAGADELQDDITILVARLSGQ